MPAVDKIECVLPKELRKKRQRTRENGQYAMEQETGTLLRHDLCISLNHLLKQQVERRVKVLNRVKKDIQLIKRLIPDNRPGRQKRDSGSLGLVPSFGFFLSGLFGLETKADSQRLMDKISIVNKKVQVNSEAIVSLHSDLLTFINLTKAEFATTFDSLKEVHENLGRMASTISDVVGDDRTLSMTMLTLIQVLADTFDNMESERRLLAISDKWLRSTYSLNSDRLSIDLIPVEDLQRQLNDVSDVLTRQYNGDWRLQYSQAPEYYHKSGLVKYGRQGNEILITLELPLETMGAIYDLFKISVFGVPLGKNSHNVTRLTKVMPYIAVSKDGRYFIDISEDMLSSCTKQGHLYECDLISYATHTDFASCSYSVYKGDTEAIMRLCGAEYGPNALQERVITLSGKPRVLMTSRAPNLVKKCAGKAEEIVPACGICLFPLECSCRYTFPGHWVIPERLGSYCFNDTHPLRKTIFHGTNAKYLSHFEHLSEEERSALSHFMSTNVEPVELLLKNDSKQWDNVVATQKQYTADFDRLMEKTQKGETSYVSKADALRDDEVGQVVDEVLSTWWMKYLTIALTVLLFLTWVFMFFKFRTITIAITMVKAMVARCTALPINPIPTMCTFDRKYFFPCTELINQPRPTTVLNTVVYELQKCIVSYNDLVQHIEKDANRSAMINGNKRFENFSQNTSLTVYKPKLHFSNFSHSVNTSVIQVTDPHWSDHPDLQIPYLVLYFISVLIVLYMLGKFVKICNRFCTNSRSSVRPRTTDLCIGLAQEDDFTMLKLVTVPYDLAFLTRDLEISPFKVEIKAGIFRGKIYIEWSDPLEKDLKDLGINLPTEIQLTFPRWGNVVSMVRDHTYGALYAHINKIYVPLANSRFLRNCRSINTAQGAMDNASMLSLWSTDSNKENIPPESYNRSLV